MSQNYWSSESGSHIEGPQPRVYRDSSRPTVHQFWWSLPFENSYNSTTAMTKAPHSAVRYFAFKVIVAGFSLFHGFVSEIGMDAMDFVAGPY